MLYAISQSKFELQPVLQSVAETATPVSMPMRAVNTGFLAIQFGQCTLH